MTLKELYNLRLHEYKETGFRDEPYRLLAMLLLSEKDKFKPVNNSEGVFYKTYKKAIDDKISKVENDFDFTEEDIWTYLEKTGYTDDYESDKIWFVFSSGFSALHWGITYHPNRTGEEIYSEYFTNNDLQKEYNIEQKEIANKLTITKLDDLISRILDNSTEFYQKICEQLSVQERLFILDNLKNKSCASCLNGSCKVENHEKIGLNEFNEPQGSRCLGWYNAELIGKSKVLRISDIHKLK